MENIQFSLKSFSLIITDLIVKEKNYLQLGIIGRLNHVNCKRKKIVTLTIRNC